MKSKDIAVSAISAGLCAIALTVGAYFEFADLFAIVIASAFVLLPLYNNCYLGSILAYLVGGIIAILLSGFNFAYSVVFPSFFAFFGIYPILRIFAENKGVKRAIIILIGLVWCVASVYGIFFYYTMIMKLDIIKLPEWIPLFIKEYFVYFIAIIGFIFYFVYDRYVLVVRAFFKKYIERIIKRN